MAINPPPDRRRPYAAAANVVGVLARIRGRNLPDRIDNDFLRLAGVPEIVYGRVNEALRFIGLVGDDSRPSDLLRALHAAPEQEYRDALAGALREAYREDFARIDPGVDTQAQIIDQFAPYQPKSQTARMVMLFLGMCREAGIAVLDAPRERKMKAATRGHVRERATPRREPEALAVKGFSRQPHQPSRDEPDHLFGMTLDEIQQLVAAGQFEDVWNALGIVAQARAQARKTLAEVAAQAAARRAEEEAEPAPE
jgi:Family of unknown function (DUF5343)